MTSATYQVTGMACEHCVRAVSSELENLGGGWDMTGLSSPGREVRRHGGRGAPARREIGRGPRSTRPATTSSPGRGTTRTFGGMILLTLAGHMAVSPQPGQLHPPPPERPATAGLHAARKQHHPEQPQTSQITQQPKPRTRKAGKPA